MEQNAKQLLKRISNKVGALTDKEISRVSHAPQEKEWRAYIFQTKPHWEDIAWRVKEPNARGEAEVHLGFFSAKPSEVLNDAIEKAETLAKGHVNHIVKNENGIRLVWKVNLNNENLLDKLFEQISDLLVPFFEIALKNLNINYLPNHPVEQIGESTNNVAEDALKVEEGDLIIVKILVNEFDFSSSRTLQVDPVGNDIVGKSYDSEDWDLHINWRKLEELESFWWDQEEEFYQFLFEKGIEYSSDEFSDFYEWEISAYDKNGNQKYSGLSRG